MRTTRKIPGKFLMAALLLLLAAACTPAGVYHDPNMDFGGIQSVAVLPFANLTTDKNASDRVRDALETSLMSTGAIYVVPAGEVARGISRARMMDPTAPSTDEAKQLGSILKVQAVMVGTIREYGEVRSGSATANVISLSVRMIETQTGREIWSAASTKGGIGMTERLFGGGGHAMNEVTMEAIHDLLNKLFM